MKIMTAEHLGMCFGVRDAIDLAKRTAAEKPVSVLGELVHNPTVIQELSERGVRMAGKVNEVATPAVIITAHGTSRKTLREVRDRGFEVQEATCPLVHFAHRALEELVNLGFHPVIVGKREHVEVRGMTGDLNAFDVILSDDDVDRLQERPRFGIVAQTTQPIERARYLVARVQARFPKAEVVFRDTVCQPTKMRQSAAEQLAKRSDVVVVVGGANSNNTRELARKCLRDCARVFHVQGPDDLRTEWFASTDRVGITAGTSTPEHLIQAVKERLERWTPAKPAPFSVRARESAEPAL